MLRLKIVTLGAYCYIGCISLPRLHSLTIICIVTSAPPYFINCSFLRKSHIFITSVVLLEAKIGPNRQQVPLLPHTECSRPRSQKHGRARQVPGVHRVNRCRFVVTSATFLDNNLHCYFSSTLFHQLLILT